jgi:hypothetical protein
MVLVDVNSVTNMLMKIHMTLIWEQMSQDFENSEEYAELEGKNLLEDSDTYDAAYEKFQESYESWPVMRRRMAQKNK